jgi:hypothetical protein
MINSDCDACLKPSKSCLRPRPTCLKFVDVVNLQKALRKIPKWWRLTRVHRHKITSRPLSGVILYREGFEPENGKNGSFYLLRKVHENPKVFVGAERREIPSLSAR